MKFAPIQYLKEVRGELKKVTWPTRRETTVSAMAVFIMVTIASIFLYAADQIIAFAIRFIMGFGL
ncbi:MAG: preprotein translocase subunit SecE [Alphaproteobacteria bacterium]